MSNIVNLFPTAIGLYNFHRDFTQQEINFAKNLEKIENIGNKKSINNYVLNNVELFEIKKFLENSLEDYFKKIYVPRDNLQLRITQSWVNYTENQEYHHKHNHPNSFISGVFYFQTNKQTDKIYFFDDTYRPFKIPAKEYNTYNSDNWWFESVAGQLLLFPSKLTHLVEVRKESEFTRISLSFNTFFVGKLGDSEASTELILQ